MQYGKAWLVNAYMMTLIGMNHRSSIERCHFESTINERIVIAITHSPWPCPERCRHDNHIRRKAEQELHEIQPVLLKLENKLKDEIHFGDVDQARLVILQNDRGRQERQEGRDNDGVKLDEDSPEQRSAICVGVGLASCRHRPHNDACLINS
eukprot:scaffold7979_cov129-Isochrysis_galbana.AAC.3